MQYLYEPDTNESDESNYKDAVVNWMRAIQFFELRGKKRVINRMLRPVRSAESIRLAFFRYYSLKRGLMLLRDRSVDSKIAKFRQRYMGKAVFRRWHAYIRNSAAYMEDPDGGNTDIGHDITYVRRCLSGVHVWCLFKWVTSTTVGTDGPAYAFSYTDILHPPPSALGSTWAGEECKRRSTARLATTRLRSYVLGRLQLPQMNLPLLLHATALVDVYTVRRCFRGWQYVVFMRLWLQKRWQKKVYQHFFAQWRRWQGSARVWGDQIGAMVRVLRRADMRRVLLRWNGQIKVARVQQRVAVRVSWDCFQAWKMHRYFKRKKTMDLARADEMHRAASLTTGLTGLAVYYHRRKRRYKTFLQTGACAILLKYSSCGPGLELPKRRRRRTSTSGEISEKVRGLLGAANLGLWGCFPARRALRFWRDLMVMRRYLTHARAVVVVANRDRLLRSSFLLWMRRYHTHLSSAQRGNKLAGRHIVSQINVAFVAWRWMFERSRDLKAHHRSLLVNRGAEVRALLGRNSVRKEVSRRRNYLRRWAQMCRARRLGRLLMVLWWRVGRLNALGWALGRWKMVSAADVIATCLQKLWRGFRVRALDGVSCSRLEVLARRRQLIRASLPIRRRSLLRLGLALLNRNMVLNHQRYAQCAQSSRDQQVYWRLLRHSQQLRRQRTNCRGGNLFFVHKIVTKSWNTWRSYNYFCRFSMDRAVRFAKLRIFRKLFSRLFDLKNRRKLDRFHAIRTNSEQLQCGLQRLQLFRFWNQRRRYRGGEKVQRFRLRCAFRSATFRLHMGQVLFARESLLVHSQLIDKSGSYKEFWERGGTVDGPTRRYQNLLFRAQGMLGRYGAGVGVSLGAGSVIGPVGGGAALWTYRGSCVAPAVLIPVVYHRHVRGLFCQFRQFAYSWKRLRFRLVRLRAWEENCAGTAVRHYRESLWRRWRARSLFKLWEARIGISNVQAADSLYARKMLVKGYFQWRRLVAQRKGFRRVPGAPDAPFQYRTPAVSGIGRSYANLSMPIKHSASAGTTRKVGFAYQGTLGDHRRRLDVYPKGGWDSYQYSSSSTGSHTDASVGRDACASHSTASPPRGRGFGCYVGLVAALGRVSPGSRRHPNDVGSDKNVSGIAHTSPVSAPVNSEVDGDVVRESDRSYFDYESSESSPNRSPSHSAASSPVHDRFSPTSGLQVPGSTFPSHAARSSLMFYSRELTVLARGVEKWRSFVTRGRRLRSHDDAVLYEVRSMNNTRPKSCGGVPEAATAQSLRPVTMIAAEKLNGQQLRSSHSGKSVGNWSRIGVTASFRPELLDVRTHRLMRGCLQSWSRRFYHRRRLTAKYVLMNDEMVQHRLRVALRRFRWFSYYRCLRRRTIAVDRLVQQIKVGMYRLFKNKIDGARRRVSTSLPVIFYLKTRMTTGFTRWSYFVENARMQDKRCLLRARTHHSDSLLLRAIRWWRLCSVQRRKLHRICRRFYMKPVMDSWVRRAYHEIKDRRIVKYGGDRYRARLLLTTLLLWRRFVLREARCRVLHESLRLQLVRRLQWRVLRHWICCMTCKEEMRLFTKVQLRHNRRVLRTTVLHWREVFIVHRQYSAQNCRVCLEHWKMFRDMRRSKKTAIEDGDLFHAYRLARRGFDSFRRHVRGGVLAREEGVNGEACILLHKLRSMLQTWREHAYWRRRAALYSHRRPGLAGILGDFSEDRHVLRQRQERMSTASAQSHSYRRSDPPPTGATGPMRTHPLSPAYTPRKHGRSFEFSVFSHGGGAMSGMSNADFMKSANLSGICERPSIVEKTIVYPATTVQYILLRRALLCFYVHSRRRQYQRRIRWPVRCLKAWRKFTRLSKYRREAFTGRCVVWNRKLRLGWVFRLLKIFYKRQRVMSSRTCTVVLRHKRRWFSAWKNLFNKTLSASRKLDCFVSNFERMLQANRRAQKALVFKFWYLKLVSCIPRRIEDGFVKKLYFNVWYSKYHLRAIRNMNLKRTMFLHWRKYIFVDLRVMYKKIHDHRNSAKVLIRYCFDLNKKFMWRALKVWKRFVIGLRQVMPIGVLKDRSASSRSRGSNRSTGKGRFNSQSYQELIKGIRTATKELDENHEDVEET